MLWPQMQVLMYAVISADLSGWCPLRMQRIPFMGVAPTIFPPEPIQSSSLPPSPLFGKLGVVITITTYLASCAHANERTLVCLFMIVSLFGLVYSFSLSTQLTVPSPCATHPPSLNSWAGAAHQSGKVSASRRFSFSPKPMDR